MANNIPRTPQDQQNNPNPGGKRDQANIDQNNDRGQDGARRQQQGEGGRQPQQGGADQTKPQQKNDQNDKNRRP